MRTLLLSALFLLCQISFSQSISSNSPICNSGADTLKLAASGGSSYLWIGPNGFFSNDQNPIIPNVSKDNQGIYKVVIDGGLSFTTFVEIGREELVFSRLTYFVSGATINLNSNYSTPTSTFKWEGPEGFESTEKSPRVTNFTKENLGEYSLTITDMFGCQTKYKELVTVENEDCPYKVYGYLKSINDSTAYWGGTDSLSFCSNSYVTIGINKSSLVLDEDVEIWWYKNDSLISEKSWEFNNSSAGSFSFKIRSGDCEYTSKKVKVRQALQNTVYVQSSTSSKGQTTICENGGKGFLSSSRGTFFANARSYLWKRNGQELVGETGKAIEVNEQGNYSVLLKEDGCVSESEPFNVKLGLTPDYSYYFNNFQGKKVVEDCFDADQDYVLSLAGAYSDYSITDNKGNKYKTGEQVNSGSYFLKLTQGACTVYDTLILKESSTFDLPLVLDKSANCGNGIGISSPISPMLKYANYFLLYDDRKLVNTNAINIAGNGRFRIYYDDPSKSCIGKTEEVTFPFESNDTQEIAGEKDVEICSGEYYSLALVEKNHDFFKKWKKDGVIIKETKLPYLTVNEPGLYWAEVEGPGNCIQFSDTIKISLKQMPSIRLTETCLPGGLGSNLETVLSDSNVEVSYRWYRDGEKLNHDDETAIDALKSGSYSLLAKVDECYIPTESVDIGPSLPSSFSYCRNETVSIKPLGSMARNIQWFSPLGAVIGSGDSLVIFNATSQDNGYYILKSESPAGCQYESDFSIEVKDPITFDVPPVLEVALGDLIIPNPTYPPLSDSTAVPSFFYYNKVESAVGPLFFKSLTATESVITVPADSTSVGLYRIMAVGSYGCRTEKYFEVKLQESNFMRLEELAQSDLCPNTEIKIPMTSNMNLPTGENFTVRMYSGDRKDSLTSIVSNDTARIAYIPPSFFKQYSSVKGVFFELSVSDGSVEPYQSKLYRFTGQYNQFLDSFEKSFCDSIRFEVLSKPKDQDLSFKWYKNNELIEEANSSSFTTSDKGAYDVIAVNASSKTCAAGNIRSFNANDFLGGINKPIISHDQEASCDSGISKLEVSNYSSDVKYSWSKNSLVLPNENNPVLNVQEDGVYSVQAKLRDCESISEPFNFKRTEIISAQLIIDNEKSSEASNSYFDYSEALQLCQQTSFKLRLGSEDDNAVYSGVKWYLDNTLIEGENLVQTFEEEGVYRATGKRGYCRVVSSALEVSYVDTIKTKLRQLGSEKVSFNLSGYINFNTNALLNNSLFSRVSRIDWYKNIDQLYLGRGFSPSSFNGDIYPQSGGAYFVKGEVITHDGKVCPIISDTVKLFNLRLDDNEFVRVDTSNISLCGDTFYEIDLSFYRVLNILWYKNGVLLSNNKSSLEVVESASYEVVYDVKDKGLYKKVFNVEIAENPEIKFSSQKLPEGIFQECIPDDFYLTLAESFFTLNDYQWYKDDVPLGFQNMAFKPSDNGVYKLKGLQNGCEGFSNSLTVNFRNSADLNLGESNQYLCNGESVELKNLNDDNELYLWLKEEQVLSFLATNTLKVETEGNYAALFEGNTCLIASNEVHIENLDIVDSLYYNLIDSIFCPGASVMLTAEEQDGLNYRFLRNDETVYSGINNIYEAKETGFYRVFYEKGNCSIGSNEFFAKRDFETDILFEYDTFCEGSSIDLSFETAEDLSYKWYKDDVPLSSASSFLRVDEAGAYFAQLSSSNCSSFSDTIQVKKHEESAASLTGAATISYGDSTDISIEISGDASPWKLTLSDGTELNIDKSPYQYFVSPTQTTEYTISSLTDECGEGVFEGSAVVNLIILGTEVNQLENIKIYPNPSDSYIFVDYSPEENPIPTLTSMEGKAVPFSYDFSDGKMRIDVTRVASGTYLLSLELEGVRTIKKLIKR
ncbi:T9SS type A sorting domain-containing protein [uncultured Arcticibacterium sp.]|uniref:T9SS type A sorting domain-containing protein n=1 Tax=uncultured Arcticibacterium sp. TaxID=2173042 RepID=UPI0030FA984E